MDHEIQLTGSRAGRNWGPWQLDSETLVLVCQWGRRTEYEIDLERCLHSGQILDWICQLSKKSWATDVVMAGLTRAIDEILEPQRRLCTFGADAEVTKAQIAAIVQTFLDS